MIRKENNGKSRSGAIISKEDPAPIGRVQSKPSSVFIKNGKNLPDQKSGEKRIQNTLRLNEKPQESKSVAETPPHDDPIDSSLGLTVDLLPPLGKEDQKTLEDSVTSLPFYHGFICRGDLPMILKKSGDFLIRVSIRDDGSAALEDKRLSVRRGSNRSRARSVMTPVPSIRDFVISVYAQEPPTTTPRTPKKRSCPIVNMGIRRSDGKYCIEITKLFKSINELLLFYKTNTTGSYHGYPFQLLNGVGLTKWEWKHADIKLLEKKLGEGAFGEVRSGEIRIDEKPVLVAVKMLKNAESLTRDQVTELLHEGRVMRQLDHKNVLRSYGLAVLNEPLYLMTELCSCGALREYLRENAKTLTPADRLNFCLGSARGVEYLHTQNLIHRDLAVRNILLSEDKTPKVSDFGLAKATDRYEMKEACKIPVRYLSPETLDTYVFTSKSDVFTFGMVIWEIYENGQQPHDGKNAHTIRDLTKKRKFLKVADSAPEAVRKLVAEKIFVTDPENRCNMSVVVQTFEKLVNK